MKNKIYYIKLSLNEWELDKLRTDAARFWERDATTSDHVRGLCGLRLTKSPAGRRVQEKTDAGPDPDAARRITLKVRLSETDWRRVEAQADYEGFKGRAAVAAYVRWLAALPPVQAGRPRKATARRCVNANGPLLPKSKAR